MDLTYHTEKEDMDQNEQKWLWETWELTEHQKQYLSALFHVLILVIVPLTFSFILLYLFITPFWFCPVGYIVWVTYDHLFYETPMNGNQRSDIIRKGPILKKLVDYFPIQLIKTAEIDPKKNYIFGYHPHGILVFGGIGAFGSEWVGFNEMFPGIKPTLCTLNFSFCWPFLRDYAILVGFVSSDKKSIHNLLKNRGTGNAVVLVTGGVEEMLEAHPGTHRLVLKNRKGFVKQAIINGANLVPVYGFGENDLFDVVRNKVGRAMQRAFKTLTHMCPPSLPYSKGPYKYTFSIVPYRRPLNIVVGKPIEVPDSYGEIPDQETVDRIHAQYVEELTVLFETHKCQYGVPPDTYLEII